MYLLQIIALSIFGFTMICAILNFRKTLLTWVPLSMIFTPQVCVWYQQPITSLTVALNIALCGYYYVFVKNNPQKYGLRNGNFFFTTAINAMLLSYVLSTLLSNVPLSTSINKIIKTFIEQYGITILLFRCINTNDDIQLFIKSIIVAGLIVMIDGIIEFSIHINPVADFIFFTSPCDETTIGRGWRLPYSISGGAFRYGLIRCYSTFALHLLFGYACCLMFFIVNFAKSKGLRIYDNLSLQTNNYVMTVMLVLFTIGVIISNSKGPLICFFSILLTKYKLTQLLKIKYIAPIIIGILIITINYPDYINNLVSLIDSDVAEEGNGSSIQGRQRQFEVALDIFSMNPLIGMGINSASYLETTDHYYSGIMGSESVWLKILPDQGLLGVLAYIIMYVTLFKNSKRHIPFRVYMFYLLAVFIFDTTNGHSIDRIIWWIGPYLIVDRYLQLTSVQLKL